MSNSPKRQIEFGWGSLEILIDEGAMDLARQHWREVNPHADDTPFDPDLDWYLAQEAAGAYRVFTARRGVKLIGYITFNLFHPPRYRSTLYVTEDIFWLLPEERKGMTGYLLLKAAFAALPRPCKLEVKHKLTFEGGRVGKLLDRLGLKPTDVVSTAFLKE